MLRNQLRLNPVFPVCAAIVFCALHSNAADQIANSYPPVIQGNARAVAVDADGNRYVTGIFQGSRDFNPGVGEDTKTSAGGDDVFVTRFNANGSYAWTQVFGGSNHELSNGITCSATAVYVTGSFKSSDAGNGQFGLFQPSGDVDGFVMALNSADGSFLTPFGSGGMQKFGGADIIINVEEGNRIIVAGPVVYVAGSFSSHNAGIGGTGTLASSPGTDALVLALDASTGTAITRFGNQGLQKFGVSTAYGNGLAVDDSRVYVAGSFNGGIGDLASAGLSDVFVCALNAADGSAVTSFGDIGTQTFGGSGNDYATNMTLLGSTLYVSGDYSSLNPRLGGLQVPGNPNRDAFVFALSAATGAPVKTFGLNGLQKFGGAKVDFGTALTASGSAVYLAGYFFSSDAGVTQAGPFATRGGYDAFVLDLSTATGTEIRTFGNAGIYQFGGTSFDYGTAAAAGNTSVFITGNFLSQNATVDGVESYDATGFGGFLAPIARAVAPPATPKITWPTPADILFGMPLDGTQLNASADVSGTFTYLPAAGTVLELGGNQTLWVKFTPDDAAQYESIVASVLIKVVPIDEVADTSPPLIRGDAAAIAIDGAGNRYVTGSFSFGADFNPHPGFDPKTNTDMSDVFVTRFNADGTYAWTQTFGGSLADSGRALVVAGGAVYVAGYFSSTDAGFGSAGSFATSGFRDAFVLALNADSGSPVVTFGTNGFQKFGGTGKDYGFAIAAANGTVYLSGSFSSTDAGVGEPGAIASSGSFDGFVLALDATNGQPKNGFAAGGVQRFCGRSQFGYGITESEGVLYWVGRIYGTDGGIGGFGTISSAGSYDAFVAALDANTGAAIAGFGSGGVQLFGGTDSDRAQNAIVSGSTLYVTGDFSSKDATIGGAGSIAANSSSDAFVLALNKTTGAAVPGFGNSGAVVFGGSGTEGGEFVCATASRLFVAGSFRSDDANVNGIGVFGSSGDYDAFVLALDPASGALVTTFGNGGLQQFGGGGSDKGLGAAVFGSTLFLAGSFDSHDAGVGGPGTFDFDSGFEGFLLPLNAADGKFSPPTLETHLSVASVAVELSDDAQTVSFNASVTSPFRRVNDGTVTIQIKNGAAIIGATVTGSVTHDHATISYILPGGTPQGSYTIDAQYSASNSFLSSVDASHSLRVGKIVPTIDWPAPAEIEFGTPLSGAQLNATADVPGIFEYTPAENTILPAGTYTLLAAFTPDDSVNCDSAVANTTLVVRKAIPTINWADPAEIVFGEALSPAQLDAKAGVAGSFAYTPAAGAILPVGTHQLSTIFTPNDGLNIDSVSASATLYVRKSVPAIVWSTPADIVAGTALSATQLNASCAVAGTFTYDPPAGRVLDAGLAQRLTVHFAPDDTANFETASASVLIDVVIIPPQITNPLTASRTQNQPFSFALTASGTQPISWSVSNLPPGLTLNAAVPEISGTPSASGAFQTGLTASNPSGSDTKVMTLVFASASGGENHRPQFSSRAVATPNPAAVNQTVAFSASATDSDGDAVVFVWDFSDGETSAGANVEHKYAAAGIYSTRVTVSDGTAQDYFNLAVAVNDSNIPPEVYAQYTVAKLGLKFNFANANKDSLSISGTIPIPAAFAPAGKTVIFQSGSLMREFTLDKKGSAAGFKLSGKLRKDGTFSASPAKFALALKNQRLFSGLEELGYANATIPKGTLVVTPIIITLSNTRYLATLAVTYSAKHGRSGAGKK